MHDDVLAGWRLRGFEARARYRHAAGRPSGPNAQLGERRISVQARPGVDALPHQAVQFSSVFGLPAQTPVAPSVAPPRRRCRHC